MNNFQAIPIDMAERWYQSSYNGFCRYFHDVLLVELPKLPPPSPLFENKAEFFSLFLALAGDLTLWGILFGALTKRGPIQTMQGKCNLNLSINTHQKQEKNILPLIFRKIKTRGERGVECSTHKTRHYSVFSMKKTNTDLLSGYRDMIIS